jgi:SRSO17 transposase
LSGFRLYLPRAWCGDSKRREQAHVPEEVEFTTKPALGTAMITAAASAGVPFAWAAADEVYGRSSRLREACEKNNKGYVLAVPVNFAVTLPSGRKATVAAVSRLIPASAWETRSCGPGCRGHRDYAWAWAATVSPRHQVLIRRSLSDPSDLAFFYCYVPGGRPVTLAILVTVTGKRWPAEECHQQGKGQAGLDQHQVRTWHSFCRHTVLSMCAQALLAVAAARPALPAARLPAAGMAGQPQAGRDTGKLPVSAGDQPPGDDPGLVKVSVPEARRLLRLAATPMSRAARHLGYAWSRWRRRHQARSRWHHYHAQLQAACVT